MKKLALLLAGLVIAYGGACRADERGPIVLITIDTLRADHVGGKLTPHLAGLASGSTWAGRAITPSSWTVPSMSSLFTGFQPGTTQTWSFDRAVLPRKLALLPEVLRARGYRTAGYRANPWTMARYGYSRGFDHFDNLEDGSDAEAHLARLDGGPDFVWVHMLPPHAPYMRHPHLADRVRAPGLPLEVEHADLEPYYDPSVPLPAETERVFRAMYALNVAWADEKLGRLLDALRSSGQWDRTLLVVTSDHGEEFREYGQIAHGGNLGRHQIEVPLVIKLPAGRKLEPKGPMATIRLRNTLIEAAGGRPEPGTAPSLFRPWEGGVLSELYLDNGVNHFSWVEGDRQLLWESHFAKPEPEYYRARLLLTTGAPAAPLDVFRRLEEAVSRALPLAGLPGDPPTLTLWRWTGNGSEPIEDARQAAEMARRLRRAWIAANGPERPFGRRPAMTAITKQEEQELRSLGYLH
ncbi:MAG TPA: sulfatase [Thermoanaerobaculia bacterium]|nr:sulfatase [Thermoanaerobaculia bacterium]